jgi:hypothetical protein
VLWNAPTVLSNVLHANLTKALIVIAVKIISIIIVPTNNAYLLVLLVLWILLRIKCVLIVALKDIMDTLVNAMYVIALA